MPTEIKLLTVEINYIECNTEKLMTRRITLTINSLGGNFSNIISNPMCDDETSTNNGHSSHYFLLQLNLTIIILWIRKGQRSIMNEINQISASFLDLCVLLHDQMDGTAYKKKFTETLTQPSHPRKQSLLNHLSGKSLSTPSFCAVIQTIGANFEFKFS